jgi:hypothetical protein
MDKYKMTSELVTSIPESGSIEPIKTLYTRIVVYYNSRKIYTEDLFGNNMYENYKVYEDIVKQHKREQKINKILNER